MSSLESKEPNEPRRNSCRSNEQTLRKSIDSSVSGLLQNGDGYGARVSKEPNLVRDGRMYRCLQANERLLQLVVCLWICYNSFNFWLKSTVITISIMDQLELSLLFSRLTESTKRCPKQFDQLYNCLDQSNGDMRTCKKQYDTFLDCWNKSL